MIKIFLLLLNNVMENCFTIKQIENSLQELQNQVKNVMNSTVITAETFFDGFIYFCENDEVMKTITIPLNEIDVPFEEWWNEKRKWPNGTRKFELPDEPTKKIAFLYQLCSRIYLKEKGFRYQSVGLEYFRSRKINENINLFNISIIEPLNKYFIQRISEMQEQIMKNTQQEQESQITKSVFIIHGHDTDRKNQVRDFLINLGLEPVILQLIPHQGKTIIEKVEGCANIGFIVTLLTADDVGTEGIITGYCGKEWRDIDLTNPVVISMMVRDLKEMREFILYPQINKEKEIIFPGFVETFVDMLKPRARQNVIFELGFFMGRFGRKRVATLIEENVEMPSDLNGLGYISFSSDWKKQLLKELDVAGMPINK